MSIKSKSSGVKSRHSLLDGVDLNKPVHEGYMYKQGHEHLAFNLRYFALYTKILVYYENEHDFKQDSSRGSLEVGGGRGRNVLSIKNGLHESLTF